MPSESISVSHAGFLCDARKVAVVRSPASTTFTVQNMALIAAQGFGAHESFQTIYQSDMILTDTALGRFGLCDFSTVTTPGIYRVVLPDSGARSYQFTIADGAFHRLPYLMLDFMHELRAGFFSSDLRGPTHLDDGVRSDTGEPWDATGGWYDAGDTRKWMPHSMLAALGFMDVAERLHLPRRAFGDGYPNDWLTEAAWGLPLIAKLQDPATGMIFEDVGGGSTARRTPEMTWWYENHAGCYADNADNRFTDNRAGTGDERSVRVQYNPIAQYTNIAIAARAYALYSAYDPSLAEACYQAAQRAWAFCETRRDDEEHTWTAVRAWRLCAALERERAGLDRAETADDAFRALADNFDEGLGFWCQAAGSDQPYRGILHSAQPIIALAQYLDYRPNGPFAPAARAMLTACLARYIAPLAATNPFSFIPFGVYRAPATEGDLYRPWRDGLLFRFAMPVNHFQRINHGLSGHWMSWAHGLAYAGRMLGEQALIDLAWAQIYWLMGNNHLDVSMVSGWGYNNPMPHSRFLGTIPGGFMNGFRGTEDDVPTVDTERMAEWNSTEYWNTPLANCLMALSWLLPAHIAPSRKLGVWPG